MKNAMKLKLSVRLTVSILGSVFIMLSLLLVVLGLKLFNNSKEEGIKQVAAQSREVAANVENYMDKAFESATSLRNVIVSLRGEKFKDKGTRDQYNSILLETLAKNKNYLAVWTIWEPNAFDGFDNIYKSHPLYSKINGAYSVTYYKNGSEIVTEFSDVSNYDEDYYTIPKGKKINTLLEPYFYSYVGDTSQQVFETSVIVPVIEKNKFIGQIAIDIELGKLSEITTPVKVFETGSASIITNSIHIAACKDPALISQNLSALSINDTIEIQKSLAQNKEYYTIDLAANGEKALRYYTPVTISGTNIHWGVMIEVPMKEVTEQARAITRMLIFLGLTCLFLFTLIIIYISRSITRPVIQAAQFVDKIANGDLTQEIRSAQKDEIGLMINNLQKMSNKIRHVVSDILAGSSNISNAGSELNLASQQLSEGANEQAASTEEVSSSMEEMVSNINQNADNAQQTERIAIKASSDIEDGSKAVHSTLEAMKKIAEKITVIGEIAEKTDLLAINAAIEAARAGEHGKGFAVVATEVRKLAERSQAAAKEINELSRSSVKIADESGSVLQKIIPDIKRTALLVQEISAASMEQNSGAAQINNAILQLNTVTQRTASSAEEISANAESLVQQSEALIDVVSFFNTGIELKKIESKPLETEKTNKKNAPKKEPVFFNKISTSTDIILPPVEDHESDYDKY